MIQNKYLRKSVPEDIASIAQNMRPEDIREVKSMAGATPEAALTSGYIYSHPCLTIVGEEGELLGMCGVASQGDGVGAIWLLGTVDIDKYTLAFMRNAPDAINSMMEDYSIVFNYVDARNSLHVRWLRLVGFTFIQKHEEVGIDKIPAYEFIRIRNV